MVHVSGGKANRDKWLKIEKLGIAVLDVWLHFSNIEGSTLKVQAILAIYPELNLPNCVKIHQQQREHKRDE